MHRRGFRPRNGTSHSGPRFQNHEDANQIKGREEGAKKFQNNQLQKTTLLRQSLRFRGPGTTVPCFVGCLQLSLSEC